MKKATWIYYCWIALYCLLSSPSLVAQQCTGSLGDPVFKETFGSAPTSQKPTLGTPLPNGITSYTFYDPKTITTTSFGPFPGQYTISNTTRGYNNIYFVDRPDHTSTDGTGFCMVVDAQKTPGQFFQKTITGLCAGTTFEFSAWVMNINPQSGVSKPSLRFDILDANNPNGPAIASVSSGLITYAAPGTWIRQAAMFQMPSTTNTIILKIFSNTPDNNGNDIALDDIAFAACGPPFIFTQAPGTVCSGNTATLRVELPAGSYSNFFFQLQNRLVGTQDWNDVGTIVNNGTNNVYTFNIPNARGGYEYRVVAAGGMSEITNTTCRVVSDPLELKIVDYTVGIQGKPNICMNETDILKGIISPKPGTGTPTTGFTYSWQTSTDGVSNWTNVTGNSTDTLSTGALSASRYYRVGATVSGCNGSGISQPFLVTVNPLVAARIDSVAGMCQGNNTFALPYNITSGSPDKFSLTSSNMPGFTNITNATLTSNPINVLFPANTLPGTYNFSVVFINSTTGCSSVPYNFTFTISAKPTPAIAGPDQQLCATPSTQLAGNTPAIGIGTWSEVNGPTVTSFQNTHDPATIVSGLTQGSYTLKWVISNGTCPDTATNMNIIIFPSPTVAYAGNDTIQYNSGTFTMHANAAIIGSGAWTIASGNATIANTADPQTTVTLAPNTSASLIWSTTNNVCPVSRDTVNIQYISRADIRVTKQVIQSPPYVAGQTLQYRMEVTNAGPSDATQVHIVDAFPANFTTTGIDSSSIGGAVILQNNSTSALIDIIASIPAGTGKIVGTLTGTINPSYGGTLTNKITATSLTVPDPDGSEASVTIAVARQPHFQVSKQAPASVIAGSNISFFVVAINDGLSNAQNAVFSDIISDRITNVSWTATITGSGNIVSGATGTGNAISITANMPAGDTGKLYITITGTVKQDATGTIANTVVATASEPVAPVPSNTTNTVIAAQSGLVITKTHTGGIIGIAGTAVSYAINVYNAGPSNAVNTSIKDTIPSNITNVQWTAENQGSAIIKSGASGTGNIINVTGDLPVGSSNQVILHVTGIINPNAQGIILNTGYAVPSEQLSTTVSARDLLTVRKTVNLVVKKAGPATAIAGEEISYTIDVENQGPSNSTGTHIQDLLPSELTNVSWTASVSKGTAVITSGATGTGNSLSLNADINANAGIRVIVYGTIAPSVSGDIRNTAYAFPSEPGSGTGKSNEVITTVTNKSVLTIDKTGPDSAVAGSKATYYLTIKNTGPSNANNITITDVVPVLTDVSWTATTTGSAVITANASGTSNNVTVTGNITNNAADAIRITITGTIPQSYAGNIINTAIVKPGVSTSIGDTASKTTIVNSKPVLTIQKNAPGVVTAGNIINWQIEVANIGLSNAVNTTITDTVPAGITNVSWTATVAGAATITQGATGSGNLMLIKGNIPAGTNNKITIALTGKAASSFDGTIVNSATATPAEQALPVTDTALTVIKRTPAISISKSGPSRVSAGQSINYTLTVKNTSVSDALNLIVTDSVPAELVNVQWIAKTTGNAAIVGAATGTGNVVKLTANIPGADSNTVQISVTGTVPPSFAGVIRNAANVLPSEPTAGRVVTDTVATIVTRQASLNINKSGPPAVNAGATFSYNIDVKNLGPSNAYATVIEDTVPSLLRNVTWTATASGGSSISTPATGTGNFIRIMADIPADTGHITLSITGTVPSGVIADTIYNSATAIPAEAGTPLQHSDTVRTIIRNMPGLQISKIAPGNLYAGEHISYIIKVTNAGPSDAKNIVITDTIPSQITDITWSAASVGDASVIAGASGTGNLIGVNASIPADANDAITIMVNGTVQPGYSGQISNTAKADPALAGVAPVTAQANTVVTKLARLNINKTGVTQASAGENISYTLIVTNDGPSDANNITVTDIIPAGILNATWQTLAENGATITSGATGTGNILLTGNIPNAREARIYILIKGKVDPQYTAPGIINQGIVYGNPAETTSDTAIVVTSIKHEANLGIIKTGPANFGAGQEITYRLNVLNYGPSVAIGALITDTLPAQLQNVTWSVIAHGNVTNISATSGTGNVYVTADIPADSSVLEVIIKATVDATVGNNVLVTNTGYVGFPTGSAIADPDQTNNSSTVNALTDNDPVVRISKSGPPQTQPGDSILYEIVVVNGGSGNLTNALIEDAVPASVTVGSWSAAATGSAVITGTATGNTNAISTTADIPIGNNTVVITVKGTVNNTASGTIANTARVTAGVIKESTINTVISNATDVSIAKVGAQQAVAGEAITYVLNVRNLGKLNADTIEISDQIPTQITNIIWKAVAYGDARIGGQTVLDSVGNSVFVTGRIPKGDSNYITIYIAGRISDTVSVPVVINTADVAVINQTDNNLSNNSSSVNTKIGRVSGLVLRKSGPLQISAGNIITYQVGVANIGTSGLTNINISDIVPSQVTNTTWSVQVTGGASVTGPLSGSGNNIATTADIPGGIDNVVSIIITGVVDGTFTGDLTNSAKASATGLPDATDTVITHVIQETGIHITKAGIPVVTAGDVIKYLVTVTNSGPANAHNLASTDTINANIQNVTWTATGTNGAIVNSGGTGSGNIVNVNMDVPAGNGAAVNIVITGTLSPAAKDTIVNVAYVRLPDPTKPPVVSPPVITIPQIKPVLSITKSAPYTVAAGDNIYYSLTVQNNGFSNAQNTRVIDNVPAAIRNVQWSVDNVAGGAVVKNGITGTGNSIAIIADMPAKASFTVNISGKVDSTYNDVLANTGIVIPAEPLSKPDSSTVFTTSYLRPKLNIEKYGPSAINAGEQITYTIRVTNEGLSMATNSQIHDAIPSVIRNVSWSAKANGTATIQGTASGNTNNLNITASIPPGTANEIVITVTGKVSPADRDTLYNSAIVTPVEAFATPDTSSVTTIVYARPVLNIVKNGPPNAIAGQRIDYTIVVRNLGVSDAQQLTIKDTVPATISGTTWTAAAIGKASIAASTINGTGNIIQVLGNIPAGDSGYITIQVSGNIVANAQGSIQNVARAVPAEPGNAIAIATTTTLLNTSSKLSIAKTGPAVFVRGQQGSYTLVVRNAGPSDVLSGVIVDTVPGVLTNVSWQATVRGGSIIQSGATGTGNNVRIIANMPASDSNYILILITGTVRQDAPDGIAYNTGYAQPDATGTNKVASQQVQSRIVSNADLSIVKTGTLQVYITNPVIYNIKITNNGPSNADGTIAKDKLPAGITPVSAAVVNASPGVTGVQPVVRGDSMIASIAQLPVGGTVTISITGTAARLGTWANTAVVTPPAQVTDPDTTNNRSNTILTTVISKEPLKIIKTVNPAAGPYLVGQTLTYTVRVTNTGIAGVNPVILTDKLPAATLVTDPNYQSPSQGSVTYLNSVRTLIWNIGLLTSGQSVTWSYQVTIVDTGSITNLAFVDGPPDVATPDTARTTVRPERYANLKIVKLLDTPLPLSVNQVLDFTFIATNNGPDIATGVIVTDVFAGLLSDPIQVTASRGQTFFTSTNRTLTWQIPPMQNGKADTMHVKTRLISGGTLTNTAAVRGNETDIDLSDNTYTITPVPITGADVFIPNMITPNGDGQNDYFFIRGLDRYPGSPLLIINRWGNQVYESKNYDNRWDGLGLKEGTYFYILKVNTGNNNYREIKGWVLLKR